MIKDNSVATFSDVQNLGIVLHSFAIYPLAPNEGNYPQTRCIQLLTATPRSLFGATLKRPKQKKILSDMERLTVEQHLSIGYILDTPEEWLTTRKEPKEYVGFPKTLRISIHKHRWRTFLDIVKSCFSSRARVRPFRPSAILIVGCVEVTLEESTLRQRTPRKAIPANLPKEARGPEQNNRTSESGPSDGHSNQGQSDTMFGNIPHLLSQCLLTESRNGSIAFKAGTVAPKGDEDEGRKHSRSIRQREPQTVNQPPTTKDKGEVADYYLKKWTVLCNNSLDLRRQNATQVTPYIIEPDLDDKEVEGMSTSNHTVIAQPAVTGDSRTPLRQSHALSLEDLSSGDKSKDNGDHEEAQRLI